MSLPGGGGSLRWRTADGVELQALHVPRRQASHGPATGPGAAAAASALSGAGATPPPETPRTAGATAVVLAHGFGGGLSRPPLQAVIHRVSAHAGVLAFDFRGHGGSGGLSTVGDKEILDVDAAVAGARALGYARVVTWGFSMGGATVIRHAALVGEQVEQAPDAVVTVSTTSRWFQRDTRPMRRVHWMVERPLGRRVARVWPGVRISAAGWHPLPASPLELIGRIAPTPLLLVHGDADPYLPAVNLTELAAAAGQGSESWLEPGLGHAEVAVSAELVDRIAQRGLVMADSAVG